MSDTGAKMEVDPRQGTSVVDKFILNLKRLDTETIRHIMHERVAEEYKRYYENTTVLPYEMTSVGIDTLLKKIQPLFVMKEKGSRQKKEFNMNLLCRKEDLDAIGTAKIMSSYSHAFYNNKTFKETLEEVKREHKVDVPDDQKKYRTNKKGETVEIATYNKKNKEMVADALGKTLTVPGYHTDFGVQKIDLYVTNNKNEFSKAAIDMNVYYMAVFIRNFILKVLDAHKSYWKYATKAIKGEGFEEALSRNATYMYPKKGRYLAGGGRSNFHGLLQMSAGVGRKQRTKAQSQLAPIDAAYELRRKTADYIKIKNKHDSFVAKGGATKKEILIRIEEEKKNLVRTLNFACVQKVQRSIVHAMEAECTDGLVKMFIRSLTLGVNMKHKAWRITGVADPDVSDEEYWNLYNIAVEDKKVYCLSPDRYAVVGPKLAAEQMEMVKAIWGKSEVLTRDDIKVDSLTPVIGWTMHRLPAYVTRDKNTGAGSLICPTVRTQRPNPNRMENLVDTGDMVLIDMKTLNEMLMKELAKTSNLMYKGETLKVYNASKKAFVKGEDLDYVALSKARGIGAKRKADKEEVEEADKAHKKLKRQNPGPSFEGMED